MNNINIQNLANDNGRWKWTVAGVAYQTGSRGEGLYTWQENRCLGTGPGHTNCDQDHPDVQLKQILGNGQFGHSAGITRREIIKEIRQRFTF